LHSGNSPWRLHHDGAVQTAALVVGGALFAVALLGAGSLPVREYLLTYAFLVLVYGFSALLLLFPIVTAFHLARAVAQATRLRQAVTASPGRGAPTARGLTVFAAVAVPALALLGVWSAVTGDGRPTFIRYVLLVALVGAPLSAALFVSLTLARLTARRDPKRRWWLDAPAVASLTWWCYALVGVAVTVAFAFALLYQPYSTRLLAAAMLLPAVALRLDQWNANRRLRLLAPGAMAAAAGALPLLTTQHEATLLFWLATLVMVVVIARRIVRSRTVDLRAPGATGDAWLVMLAAGVLCLAAHVYQTNFPADSFAASHRTYNAGHPYWAEGQAPKFYDVKNVGEETCFTDSRPANRVLCLDAAGLRVTRSPALTDGLEQLAPQPGSDVLLAGSWGGAVTVLNPSTLEALKTCPTRPGLIDLAAAPGAGRAVYLREFVPAAWFIDTADCRTEPLQLPTRAPYQALCPPAANRCFVSGWMHASALSLIELNPDGKPSGVRPVKIGPFAAGMAYDESGARLFVTRPLAAAIDVLDGKTGRRLARLSTAPLVRDIAYIPELDALAAPEYFSGKTRLLAASDGRRLAEFRLGDQVREISWDGTGGALLAVDRQAVYGIPLESLRQLIAGTD
jgi:hypothetical protein